MISFFKKPSVVLADKGLGEKEIEASTLYRDAWRRLKKNKLAMLSFCAIILISLMAIFAPLIAPYDPYQQDLMHICEMPSAAHIFGTDSVGRDLFSRIIYGSRVSLLVGIVCEAIAVPIGVILGSIAGYFGGWVDMVISRLMEILSSFPFLLFAICIMFILGTGSILNVFIALGIVGWIGHARIIRGQVMQLKEKEFVEAARASGASDRQIIFKHLIPNCISTIIIVATIDIPSDIIYEATLSFVGMGVQPPEPSWGSIISEARKFIRQNPWYSVWPGIALMILTLAFNTFGDGLRDALDPKLKNL
jgi:peptide/nickel transport system permease protein